MHPFYHLPFYGFQVGCIFSIIPYDCVDDFQKLPGNSRESHHPFHLGKPCVIIMPNAVVSDGLDCRINDACHGHYPMHFYQKQLRTVGYPPEGPLHLAFYLGNKSVEHL